MPLVCGICQARRIFFSNSSCWSKRLAKLVVLLMNKLLQRTEFMLVHSAQWECFVNNCSSCSLLYTKPATNDPHL